MGKAEHGRLCWVQIRQGSNTRLVTLSGLMVWDVGVLPRHQPFDCIFAC